MQSAANAALLHDGLPAEHRAAVAGLGDVANERNVAAAEQCQRVDNLGARRSALLEVVAGVAQAALAACHGAREAAEDLHQRLRVDSDCFHARLGAHGRAARHCGIHLAEVSNDCPGAQASDDLCTNMFDVLVLQTLGGDGQDLLGRRLALHHGHALVDNDQSIGKLVILTLVDDHLARRHIEHLRALGQRPDNLGRHTWQDGAGESHHQRLPHLHKLLAALVDAIHDGLEPVMVEREVGPIARRR
mmetsp:Transcript_68759/g.177107  ORF Transcript_68759/g.177107 Transcript_68759/m.177107 type:complete len:246 (-) Transcript_68759:651-1388(-)